MKRTVTVLLCVFITAFLCSCTQQGTSNQPKPSEKSSPQSTQTPGRQSEPSAPANEMKLAVNLPEGWNPVEGSKLSAHYIKNDSAVFMVTKQGYSGDIDTVTKLAKAANEKSYAKLEYKGETESVKIDGKDARKFVCTYEFGGVSMKSMFVYFLYGRDTYSIVFTDFAISFDALSNDYAAILSQIKLK